MLFFILSKAVTTYTTRRLAWHCRRAGHEVRLVDPLTVSIRLTHQRPELFHEQEAVGDVGVVIPRLTGPLLEPGLPVLRQLEQRGTVALNGSDSLGWTRDRLVTLQHLVRHDITLPPTAFVNCVADVRFAIDLVGGPPVVVKSVEGSRKAMLARTVDSAASIVEALTGVHRPVIVQAFVEEASGVHLRALVVGGRVVAAVRRRAPEGTWRADGMKDVEAEAVELSADEDRVAREACRALGLAVAAVDLLETSRGPMLVDVDPVPALESIERATGEDVAEAIVALGARSARKGATWRWA